MKKVFIFIFIFFSIGSISLANLISDTKYGKWELYENDQSYDKKKCYLVSNPISNVSNYNLDRKPYISIIRFIDKNNHISEEVNVYSGFQYKGNLYLSTNNNQFVLSTNDKLAWADSKKLDKEIIQSFLISDFIKVRSISSFSTYSVDIYSTEGIITLYKRMKSLCSFNDFKQRFVE